MNWPPPRAEKDPRKGSGACRDVNRINTARLSLVDWDKLENYKELPEYVSNSKYNYSKNETGKTAPQHKGVKEWHYFNNRIQEIRDKENIIIGQIPLRKGPEKRVEEYIDPKTGLPSCVYGKYAPFNPYAEPNNMRHLRRMQEKLKKPEENQEKDRVVQI